MVSIENYKKLFDILTQCRFGFNINKVINQIDELYNLKNKKGVKNNSKTP